MVPRSDKTQPFCASTECSKAPTICLKPPAWKVAEKENTNGRNRRQGFATFSHTPAMVAHLLPTGVTTRDCMEPGHGHCDVLGVRVRCIGLIIEPQIRNTCGNGRNATPPRHRDRQVGRTSRNLRRLDWIDYHRLPWSWSNHVFDELAATTTCARNKTPVELFYICARTHVE
jgi:hypothetical protein